MDAKGNLVWRELLGLRSRVLYLANRHLMEEDVCTMFRCTSDMGPLVNRRLVLWLAGWQSVLWPASWLAGWQSEYPSAD